MSRSSKKGPFVEERLMSRVEAMNAAGEKRMITKARQILVSELAYATGGDEEKAEAMIDKVLDDSHGARVMAEA